MFLIVNPVAGRGRALRALPRVEAWLEARGLPYRTLHTERPGHARELVRCLPEGARVLSLGGDGTLHEVAAACVGTERCLGVLPGGSGDDFAFALGLERRELETALEAAVAGGVRRVDTGVVNGRPFLNAVGVGFDAEVAHGVRCAPALLKEQAAYLYAVVDTLRRLETPRVEVRVGGRPCYRGPALLASVLNGRRTGGSFLFAPGAKLEDGELDLVLATDVGRLGVLGLLPRVMKGRHLGHPKVVVARGKEIHMRWEKPMRGHAEGELLAPAETFEICVRPASLKVAVGASQGGKPL